MRFASALAAIAVLAFTDVALAAPAATPTISDSTPATTTPVPEAPEECDSEAPDNSGKDTPDGSSGGLSLTAQLRLADT
jgi:hypothetical protein